MNQLPFHISHKICDMCVRLYICIFMTMLAHLYGGPFLSLDFEKVKKKLKSITCIANESYSYSSPLNTTDERSKSF